MQGASYKQGAFDATTKNKLIGTVKEFFEREKQLKNNENTEKNTKDKNDFSQQIKDIQAKNAPAQNAGQQGANAAKTEESFFKKALTAVGNFFSAIWHWNPWAPGEMPEGQQQADLWSQIQSLPENPDLLTTQQATLLQDCLVKTGDLAPYNPLVQGSAFTKDEKGQDKAVTPDTYNDPFFHGYVDAGLKAALNSFQQRQGKENKNEKIWKETGRIDTETKKALFNILENIPKETRKRCATASRVPSSAS